MRTDERFDKSSCGYAFSGNVDAVRLFIREIDSVFATLSRIMEMTMKGNPLRDAAKKFAEYWMINRPGSERSGCQQFWNMLLRE